MTQPTNQETLTHLKAKEKVLRDEIIHLNAVIYPWQQRKSHFEEEVWKIAQKKHSIQMELMLEKKLTLEPLTKLEKELNRLEKLHGKEAREAFEELLKEDS